MEYRTYFKLTNPVLDVYEANCYLHEDDMTNYLKESKSTFKDYENFIDKVTSIKWNLKDNESGYISLISEEKLPEKLLKNISEWVSGQNSDGLGEGFEQQPFAFYSQEDYDKHYGYNVSYEDDEDNFMNMCSFDWQTNEYIFEEI